MRYNPEGGAEANAVQRRRLAEVSRVSHDAGSRFLVELLVPPTLEQLALVGGDVTRYETELRPRLSLAAMGQIVADMAVDVWKLEHMAASEHYRVASELAAERGGCAILLGANAPGETVDRWLRDAATSGFVGFAVGRSIWWDALRRYLAGEIDRNDAIAAVADRYIRFAQRFLAAGARSN